MNSMENEPRINVLNCLDAVIQILPCPWSTHQAFLDTPEHASVVT